MAATSLFDILLEDAERKPLSVHELNAQVRQTIEQRFASVWVEGEITNFTAHSSGHWYFGLKDGSAQVKAVCWKTTNFRIRYKPRNGDCVRVRGRLSVYEPRGEYQIVVDSLEPEGEGALKAAFEQIKAKLLSEGLFDERHKRQLPAFPRRVAVVTSPTGAAYFDIHNVLTRRARAVHLLLIPSAVQGEGAADSIRRAVIAANRYNSGLEQQQRIDVMIVGRGGGSAEDLWAFNDESLARAIRSSDIPIISAVGHEIDWTICDFVADLRAATPSAAAEMVAQHQDEIENAFKLREMHLQAAIGERIRAEKADLDELSDRLQFEGGQAMQAASARFERASSRLVPEIISGRVKSGLSDLALLDQRRDSSIQSSVKAKFESANVVMARLNALSPLAVLTRGYSIAQRDDGSIVREAGSVKQGERLTLTVQDGKIETEVIQGNTDG